MKTFLEAVLALQEAGWGKSQARRAATDLLPPQLTMAGVSNEPQIDQAALDQVIRAGPPPLTVKGVEQLVEDDPFGKRFVSPEVSPKVQKEIEGRKPEEEFDPEVRAAVERIQAGVGTPEDYALAGLAAEEDPDLFGEFEDSLADILAEGKENSYDWVHKIVAVGSLDSNEALIKWYEMYVEIDPPPDVKTDRDEIVADAKSILSRGRLNESVFFALTRWGQASGNYTPTRQTDDVNNSEILEMMDKYNIDDAEATTIGRVANSLDMEPLDLGEIWDSFAFKEGQTIAVTEAEQLSGELRDFKFVRRGLLDVAKSYKQGLGLFDQSHLLASIYVGDPGLAERLRSDPYSLDSGELQAALKAVGGGEDSQGDPQVNWIKERLAGGFRASAEVDKESMRNAVQVLADGWNLTGTEAIVGALTAELVSQAVAQAQASLPNPFAPIQEGVRLTDTIQDQAAHVKRRLRATPEYKELFAHLAGGESEEEFVRRFENRSQQVLGDDVVSAVRTAMRTGNVNTIFQQGLNTPIGESSTRFQEILARNAQTFRDLL